MALRLALDTNSYTDLCRDDPTALETVESADEIWLPFIVLAELRAGFSFGSKPAQNEAILQRFLLQPRVRVVFPDEQTTYHYANLYQQLRRQGTLIPANDIWIAALVVQYSLSLYTRDTHFDVLPQIPRV